LQNFHHVGYLGAQHFKNDTYIAYTWLLFVEKNGSGTDSTDSLAEGEGGKVLCVCMPKKKKNIGWHYSFVLR